MKEVQKYAAGKLLYIPSGEEKRVGAKRRVTELNSKSAIE